MFSGLSDLEPVSATLIKEALPRIMRNDPLLLRLVLNLVDFCDMDDLLDLGGIGRYIGRHTSIALLDILDDENILSPLRGQMEAVYAGVSQSRSVKSMEFRGCRLEGPVLQLFEVANLEKAEFVHCTITAETGAAVRRASRLRHVDINSEVDSWNDEDAADFISSLNHTYKLEVLCLSGCIPDGGVRALGGILSDSRSNIRKLKLFANSPSSIISDEILLGLQRALTCSSSLRELILHQPWSYEMTLEGWQVVSNVLSSTVVSREVLVTKKDTIENFDVEFCSDITLAGWIALSTAFLTPMPNLSELAIGNANFDDTACLAFASCLNNKPSLKVLNLGNSNITTTGWGAISKSLCDTSSLDAIRRSNHTLCEIEVSASLDSPPSINKLLKMNRSGNGNVSKVVCLKIVEYYDNIDIESIVYDKPEVQTKLVPAVISWLGNDPHRQTALFRFIRNQAFLFENASKACSGDGVPLK